MYKYSKLKVFLIQKKNEVMNNNYMNSFFSSSFNVFPKAVNNEFFFYENVQFKYHSCRTIMIV
jgi:hypothetical protein